MSKQQVAARKIEAGTKILVDYARDDLGRHHWRERGKLAMQGPFPTREAAQWDCETKIFGSQCTIKEGGQWDPAWDKKQ